MFGYDMMLIKLQHHLWNATKYCMVWSILHNYLTKSSDRYTHTHAHTYSTSCDTVLFILETNRRYPWHGWAWWRTPVVSVAWEAGAGLCLSVQGQHPGCQVSVTLQTARLTAHFLPEDTNTIECESSTFFKLLHSCVCLSSCGGQDSLTCCSSSTVR